MATYVCIIISWPLAHRYRTATFAYWFLTTSAFRNSFPMPYAHSDSDRSGSRAFAVGCFSPEGVHFLLGSLVLEVFRSFWVPDVSCVDVMCCCICYSKPFRLSDMLECLLRYPPLMAQGCPAVQVLIPLMCFTHLVLWAFPVSVDVLVPSPHSR